MSSAPTHGSHSLAVLADKDGNIISAVRSGAGKDTTSPSVGIVPTNNQPVHNLMFSSEEEMTAVLGEIGQYRLRHEGGQPTLSRLNK